MARPPMNEAQRAQYTVRLRDSVVEAVQEYWDAFSRPLSASALGRRYHRQAKMDGISMQEMLAELCREGRLVRLLTDSLGRFYLPGAVWSAANAELKQALYLGLPRPRVRRDR